MTICLDVFLIQSIWEGKYDEYCLKIVIFLSVLDKEMNDEVLYIPPFFFFRPWPCVHLRLLVLANRKMKAIKFYTIQFLFSPKDYHVKDYYIRNKLS